jgi:hypothetical protein
MGYERVENGWRRRRRGVLAGAVLLAVGTVAQAQGASTRPEGRGFVWGVGLSGGRLAVSGGEGTALAVGHVMGYRVDQASGDVSEVRTGALVDAAHAPLDAGLPVVGLPSSEDAAGLSMHAGYAFSRRLALLLEIDLAAGVDSRAFTTVFGGVVARWWPTRRVWLEAGPASGDLSYTYEMTSVEKFSGTGVGVRAAAGVSVLRRPRWSLDLEGRYGKLWFDGLQVQAVSFGLSASRLPL